MDVYVFFLSAVETSDLFRVRERREMYTGFWWRGGEGGNRKERDKWEDLEFVAIKLDLKQVART